MPEKENDNVIQLDDSFNVLDDILKKEPEASKPASKIGKFQEYLTQHKKIAILLAVLLRYFPSPLLWIHPVAKNHVLTPKGDSNAILCSSGIFIVGTCPPMKMD